MELLLIFSLGSCWGSFVALIISRFKLPYAGAITFWQLLQSSSQCDSCQHRLYWYQLIPIVSWCYLLGHCGFCRAPISGRLVMIELLSGVIFVTTASLIAKPYLALILLLVAIFILLALLDLYYLLLPDCFTLPLLYLGLLASYWQLTPLAVTTALYGVLWGFCLLWIPAKLYQLCCKQTGLGGGDIKLLMMLGSWLPYWQLSGLIIFASSIMLLYFGLKYSISQSKQTKLPYGFGLLLGGWLLILYNYHTL